MEASLPFHAKFTAVSADYGVAALAEPARGNARPTSLALTSIKTNGPRQARDRPPASANLIRLLEQSPRPVSNPGTIQFVNVPHCDAMRSAPRCDSAKIVNVGFEAPSVGKMPGPATQRFGISWLWP
jgi:hypothetical protein